MKALTQKRTILEVKPSQLTYQSWISPEPAQDVRIWPSDDAGVSR